MFLDLFGGVGVLTEGGIGHPVKELEAVLGRLVSCLGKEVFLVVEDVLNDTEDCIVCIRAACHTLADVGGSQVKDGADEFGSVLRRALEGLNVVVLEFGCHIHPLL